MGSDTASTVEKRGLGGNPVSVHISEIRRSWERNETGENPVSVLISEIRGSREPNGTGSRS